jgi:hypothetical protein
MSSSWLVGLAPIARAWGAAPFAVAGAPDAACAEGALVALATCGACDREGAASSASAGGLTDARGGGGLGSTIAETMTEAVVVVGLGCVPWSASTDAATPTPATTAAAITSRVRRGERATGPPPDPHAAGVGAVRAAGPLTGYRAL